MSHVRSHTGFTLIETLVMGAVAFLILAVVAQIFITVSRGTRQSAEEVSLQQRAALVVDRVVSDLKSSTSTQMLLTEDITAIRVLEDVSPEGNQIWSKELRVYRYSVGEETLYLSKYELAESDTRQGHLFIDESVLSGTHLEERVLARGVKEFSLTPGSTWKLRLVVVSEDKTRDLTVERMIFLPLKDR